MASLASSLSSSSLSASMASDSPEAIAQALALIILADADISPQELRVLRELDAYNRMGLSEQAFMKVLQAHACQLEHRLGDVPFLRLDEVALMEETLALISKPATRLLVARMAAALITADGQVSNIERQIFDQMLYRWGLSHDEVHRAILEEYATTSESFF